MNHVKRFKLAGIMLSSVVSGTSLKHLDASSQDALPRLMVFASSLKKPLGVVKTFARGKNDRLVSA